MNSPLPSHLLFVNVDWSEFLNKAIASPTFWESLIQRHEELVGPLTKVL